MELITKIKTGSLDVCDNADSFLQSGMWGEFKSFFGWQPRAFTVSWNCGESTPLLVLEKKLIPGFSFAYVPWGPELPPVFTDAEKSSALNELAQKLKQFLPASAFFIRFDLPWFVDRKPVFGKDFTRAAADIQAPDTVLVDLSVSPEEMLARMKPKWRYNIGLAEKRGVIITDSAASDTDRLNIFYKLLGETAKRDGIAIHSIDYYRRLFDVCNSYKINSNSKDNSLQLHLYIASHGEDVLAAIIVLFRGAQAVYLYGASSNIKRNLMAPYALQWKAMQDAKNFGCMSYDLFGIPPAEDPDHPMAGLYRFKTGFGGEILHRPGSWDYPCRKFLYWLFRNAEGLRKRLRDRKKR